MSELTIDMFHQKLGTELEELEPEEETYNLPEKSKMAEGIQPQDPLR